MRGDGASKFRIVLGLIQVLFIVVGLFFTRFAYWQLRKLPWQPSIPSIPQFVARYGIYFLAWPPIWWIISRSRGRSARETREVDGIELAVGILSTLAIIALFSKAALWALGPF